MTTNHAYLTKKIKVRDDHLAALTAKCKAMGETVTLDFYVNDALAQYLGPDTPRQPGESVPTAEGDDVR